MIKKLRFNAIILLAALITLIGWSYFILDIKYIYPMDWDFFLGQYEAIRRTILEFHQFPFWHPWHSGGTPLFAHIDIGVFSIDTICVLIFGTVAGLKVSVIIHLIIGGTGMYFLIGRYTSREFIKFWGFLLFTLQGAIAIHVAIGHINMMSIAWLPWILYLSFYIKVSLNKSLLLGLLLAVSVNEGIHYNAIFVMFVAGIAILIQLIKNRKDKAIFLHFSLLLLLFFSLSFYRLYIAFSLSMQYPREMPFAVTIPICRYIYGLFYPGQYPFSFSQMLVHNGEIRWLWHEFGCYIGIASFILFLFSFLKGVKWWHIGAVLSLICAIDSASHYFPGYWIRTLPVFKSMWVITRWKFLFTFFVFTGACSGLDYLFNYFSNRKTVYKKILYLMVLISIAGLLYNQFFNWYEYGRLKVNEKELFSQLKSSSSSIITSGYRNCNRRLLNYPCAANGIGLLYSYENLLGYKVNYKSARIPIEARENYKGEIFPIDKNSLDILWTPDKIFIHAKNKGRIWINQNPGNYWFLNGKQLFPNYKAFEMDKPFIIKLPKGGNYILKARPPYNRLLIITNIVIFILFILSLVYYRKKLSKASMPY